MAGKIELITSRPAVVGAGSVDRFLPNRFHRMIGAWCFLDVFASKTAGSIAVGPHPHIGIQTVTWLVDGVSQHRDSLGSLADVEPGSLSLMTAGSGIAHAETSPEDAPSHPIGAQLWIALPDPVRSMDPSFAFHSTLPSTSTDGVRLRVLLGSLDGITSPARCYSPLVGAALALPAGSRRSIELDVGFEHGVVVLVGSVRITGAPVTADRLAYIPTGWGRVEIESDEGAELLLIGGAPFEEEIIMWWNLVARTEEEIVQARDDWEAHRRFGEVIGGGLDRIPAPPLPTGRLRPRPARPR